MSDLINRKAAIDALGERPMVWTDDDEYALGERSQYDTDRLAIETLPSAQPEIIRCKECKHIVEHEGYGNLGESAFTCEGNMDGWVLPDGYCSYAVKREGDDE